MLEPWQRGHVAAAPPHSFDGDGYAPGEEEDNGIALRIVGCNLHPDWDNCGGGGRRGAAGGRQCDEIVCLLALPLEVAAR